MTRSKQKSFTVKPFTDDMIATAQNRAALHILTAFERISDAAFSEADMAVEIIVRRRRNPVPPPGADAPEKSESPETSNKDDPPANDNEETWPFIPFPDG